MRMKRRDFLKLGAAAGAGVLFMPKKLAFAQASPSLTPFVDSLPVPQVLPRASRYDIPMKQFKQKLHRDLPSTTLWGYNGQYLGPTFETRTGQPIDVQWLNQLPTTHPLPIDHTIHGAEANQPQVRTVVHLHGAKVLGSSDGHPEAWFTNGFAQTGPEFDHRVYHYPNDQAAMNLWYHDHALGNTRLNFMMGLQGLYFIRDTVDDALVIPKGRYEIPLVFQDRFFNPDGSLLYPMQDPSVQPPIPPIWIPEFFGDTGLVNGKVWPFLNVEPRKYRFRLLDACNARFLHLTLVNASDATETLTFHQIGSDQGFLPAPVELPDLLMGPAERFDVVIDFTGKQGKWFTLMNDAPAPFPGGGAADVPFFMQFRVVLPLSQPDHALPTSLAPVPLLSTNNVKVRKLLLSELDDATTGDPIIGQLGTSTNGPQPRRWADPATENIQAGDTEMWELYNTTTDGHPIHVHLVRFQIVNRQPFDLNQFEATGQIVFTGPPEAPAPNERPAWKDVVKAFPGDPSNGIGRVTRIIQNFAFPNVQLDSEVQEYVWHCHILEHEDNEMMRPLNVIADKGHGR